MNERNDNVEESYVECVIFELKEYIKNDTFKNPTAEKYAKKILKKLKKIKKALQAYGLKYFYPNSVTSEEEFIKSYEKIYKRK
jgi:rRNA-processing protein FCF1